MIRIYISYLTYENQIKWNESNYIPFYPSINEFNHFSGDGSTDCKYDGMAYEQSSSAKEVTSTDLKSGVTELPYKASSSPLCGGKFEHITDTTDGKDKIEYEVCYHHCIIIYFFLSLRAF